MKQEIQRASLATQLAGILREEIQGGQLGQSLPGELPLCERFKVSRATLRSALAELELEGWIKAGQGRRREILRVRRAGKPPPLEQKVVLLSPVGLSEVVPAALFWMDALRAFLAEAGYGFEVHHSHAAYAAQPGRALTALGETLRPAGWVLYLSTEPMQRWFVEQRLPCLITGSRHPDIALPALDTDYRALCRHAAGLCLARGRRRLALVMAEPESAGDLESERGFLEAAAKTPDADAQVVRHDGSVAGLCLLLDRLLKRPAPPTAYVVSKPGHALTLVSYLMRRGVRLPEEALVVSRDDDPLLAHLVPTMARYAVDQARFARRASRLLLELLRGGPRHGRVGLLMPRFIPGETLG